jgi:hypothetical protein
MVSACVPKEKMSVKSCEQYKCTEGHIYKNGRMSE